jgi:hypothetical protein
MNEHEWTRVVSKSERKRNVREKAISRSIRPSAPVLPSKAVISLVNQEAPAPAPLTTTSTASHQIATASENDIPCIIPNIVISDITNYYALVQLRISGALLTRHGCRTLLDAFGNHVLSALTAQPYSHFRTCEVITPIASALELWETRIMPILLGTFSDQSAFKWVWVSERGAFDKQAIKSISFAELVETRPEYGYFGAELSHPEFKEPAFWRWLVNLWTPKPCTELAATNWDHLLTPAIPIERYGDLRRYLGLQLTANTLVSIPNPGARSRSFGYQVCPLLKEFDRENKWTDEFTFGPRDAERLHLHACIANRFRGGSSLLILLHEFVENCAEGSIAQNQYQPVPNAISWPLPFVITDSLDFFIWTYGSREKYQRMCRTAFAGFQIDRLLGFRALQEGTGLIHELCELVAVFLAGPDARGIVSPTVQNRSLSSWITDGRTRYGRAAEYGQAADWLVPVAVEELTQVMDFTFRPVLTK